MLQTLVEIIDGCSSEKSKIFGPCIVRHTLLRDEAYYQKVYDESLELARAKKLLTKEEALEMLDKKGLWTKNDEARLNQLASLIKNAQKSLETLPADLGDQMDGELRKYEAEELELLERKNRSMLPTAEKYAAKLAFDKYAPTLFAKPVFTQEELDYMSDESATELIRVFTDVQNRFAQKNVKLAAISPVMQHYLGLSEDNSQIFGKPIVEMTSLQVNLLYLARGYKSVIDEVRGKVDDSMFEDPDAIEEWLAGSQRDRDILERKWGAKVGAFSSAEAIEAAAVASEDRLSGMKAVQRLL